LATGQVAKKYDRHLLVQLNQIKAEWLAAQTVRQRPHAQAGVLARAIDGAGIAYVAAGGIDVVLGMSPIDAAEQRA